MVNFIICNNIICKGEQKNKTLLYVPIYYLNICFLYLTTQLPFFSIVFIFLQKIPPKIKFLRYLFYDYAMAGFIKLFKIPH